MRWGSNPRPWGVGGTAQPGDLASVDLATYKGCLRSPWTNREYVVERGREWASLLARVALAQILDRGEMDAWGALYRLAKNDPELRRRILGVVRTVPIALPRLWLAALASLGEPVDLGGRLPSEDEAAI